MRIFARKSTSLFTVIMFSLFALLPLRAHAVVPPLLDFGGTNVFSIPCTCTDGFFWSFFAPLHLQSEIMAGPLAYIPGESWLFANYVPPIESEAPYLGGYMPGVQACWMYAAYACFPLPNYGVIAFLGTGIPGGSY